MVAKTLIISSNEREVFFPSGGNVEDAGAPALDGSPGLRLTSEACFEAFDKDKDSALNLAEFSALLEALFRDEKGQPYTIDENKAKARYKVNNIEHSALQRLNCNLGSCSLGTQNPTA